MIVHLTHVWGRTEGRQFNFQILIYSKPTSLLEVIICVSHSAAHAQNVRWPIDKHFTRRQYPGGLVMRDGSVGDAAINRVLLVTCLLAGRLGSGV
jgi:hypothetical protein